jgi:tryptophan halogenase
MSSGSPRDSVRGRLTDDGMALETGYADRDPQGRTQSVRLAERITLTPAAARHLAISLEEALATRRAGAAKPVFGVVPADAVPDRVTPRGRTPVHASVSTGVEVSTRLINAVNALDIPYQHERSVRIAPGRMEANRYLLTCNVADLGSGPLATILSIVGEVGFPGALQDKVGQWLGTAACVHFGFEERDGVATCKLYLERALDSGQLANGSREPVMLHRAFKWQPADSGYVETHYLLYPNLDAEALSRLVAEVYSRTENSRGAAFVDSALAVALQRTDARRLAFLKVTEEENPRDSCDINFYEAGFRVKDLRKSLFDLREVYGVPPGRFQALYDQIRERPLGHIAGGVHRDGEEFVTIYYGLAGLPRFSADLGAGRGAVKRTL